MRLSIFIGALWKSSSVQCPPLGVPRYKVQQLMVGIIFWTWLDIKMHHWNLISWCNQIPVPEEGKETFTWKESIALNNEKAEKLIRLKLPSVFLLQKQMRMSYRAKCDCRSCHSRQSQRVPGVCVVGRVKRYKLAQARFYSNCLSR